VVVDAIICKVVAVAFALATVCTLAGAASSGSGGRSGSSSSKASGGSSTRYSPAASPPSRSGARSGAWANRRALISPSGPQPSAKVATIIKQRESSAGGLLGAALLFSLLSRSDLSASDRAWIEGRIATMKKSGDEDDGLVQAVEDQVQFTFSGLEKHLSVGQTAKLTVFASNSMGRALPVVCELPGSRTTSAKGSPAVVVWQPLEPGPRLLSCKAGEHVERRLIRVGVPPTSPSKSPPPPAT
jgi:hypothetical protein